MDRLQITEKGISLHGDEKIVPRFHWFHRWTEWVTVSEGNLVNRCGDHMRLLGSFKRQERHCVVYGKLAMRKLQETIFD